MDSLNIDKDKIETLYETRFLNMYDLRYAEGRHYFEATRRNKDTLVALKKENEIKSMLPDAVTLAIVLHLPESEPLLLLFYEYRYPVAHYMLSPVAGLIDEEDLSQEDPLRSAAIREIKEETGLTFGHGDTLEIINPCAFSSPGMTDESNAFLCAHIYKENTDELSHDGAVGGEKFSDFVLLNKEQALKIFKTGRDENGHFYSLSTWAVLSYFILE